MANDIRYQNKHLHYNILLGLGLPAGEHEEFVLKKFCQSNTCKLQNVQCKMHSKYLPVRVKDYRVKYFFREIRSEQYINRMPVSEWETVTVLMILVYWYLFTELEHISIKHIIYKINFKATAN